MNKIIILFIVGLLLASSLDAKQSSKKIVDREGPIIYVTSTTLFAPDIGIYRRPIVATFNFQIISRKSKILDAKIDIYQDDKKTKVFSSQITGMTQIIWNGTNNQIGGRVGEGKYYHYMIKATDSLKNSSQTTFKKIYFAIGMNGMPGEVCLNLPNIEFDTNSAVLASNSMPVLNAIGIVIKKLTNVVFTIEGHADPSETVPQLALSIQRANTVYNYLRNRYSIPANKLKASGKGSSEAAPAYTSADRARNRRVTIIIRNVSISDDIK